jgi:hypothetical protein
MSNLEPTDVGPAAGGDRPVAEGDRQHVLTLLNSAHAEGVLTAAERDRRLAEARAAVTFDDLVPLTRDLVSGRPSVSYDTAHASGNADQIVAIFGGTRRTGRWRVHPETNVSAAFGGVELDLSEATFEANELQFSVNCLFGGVEMTVPEGTEVVSHVAAVFGGADVHRLAPPQPGMPRIVVTGFVLFGGLNVRNRRGHNGWDAEHYAARQAERAQRHAEHHAARAQRHAERHAERLDRHYHG